MGITFVSVAEMLKEARAGRYAVGAFNCNNMEIVQAIITAAEAEKAPVIIQASQGAIRYAGIEYIVEMTRTAARGAGAPVALHLDHGTGFEQVVRCIRAGFSSVMFDGSKLPVEENISTTNKVLEVARAVGVSVEAELGKIGGTEDDITVSEKEAMLTDPEEAKYFVDKTGVDCLAVAIGTAHGPYKGTPELDLKRLEKIVSLVDIPIVLHGSSGVPAQDLREAIKRGICKVNIDTDIRQAFTGECRRVLEENPGEYDPRKVMGPAREAAVEVIREKIRTFGSSGKA